MWVAAIKRTLIGTAYLVTNCLRGAIGVCKYHIIAVNDHLSRSYLIKWVTTTRLSVRMPCLV